MDVPACFSYILGFLGEGGMDGRLRGGWGTGTKLDEAWMVRYEGGRTWNAWMT